ncbi:MAG: TIGR00159 family protein [Candidatus Muiribacterium halophilum]|uniref:Diadenylate cyclase n=1 Tax=Muiribacterium halophilum TaxID=2053465 RepID=A0A2N5ZHK6_MUIH1|nr:MAG: TIGR00159 family protein [Candidatus Muirbacterium halophilum]
MIRLLTDLQWNDFLDILLVGAAVYYFLLFIKDTRAFQIFLGMLVIVIPSIMANILELNTLQWIVSNIIPIGILAFVVIFQPELRKVFERIGRRTAFGKKLLNIEEISKLIDQIVISSRLLAKQGLGALIVLQRDTGLKEFIDSGIKVQATYSKELALTIFQKSSALHDGAIILNGNIVEAASCFLPLTENHFIDKKYGTRHRAAIGITEQSDAIVIVVSEERKVISVVKEGEINEVSEKILKKILKEDLMGEK